MQQKHPLCLDQHETITFNNNYKIQLQSENQETATHATLYRWKIAQPAARS
jgi:hypothetical protein